MRKTLVKNPTPKGGGLREEGRGFLPMHKVRGLRRATLMKKIKPKEFKPRLARGEHVIFIRNAATYYALLHEQYQHFYDEQATIERADYYQRILDGIRGIHYETSD